MKTKWIEKQTVRRLLDRPVLSFTHMQIQFFIGLICLTIAGAASPVYAAESGANETSMREQQRCSKLLDPNKRLSCFDRIGTKDNKEPMPNNTQNDQEAFLKSAKGILRALKRMEAKTSAGISYRDYSQALADVIFETSEFVDGDYGGFNKEFTAEILEAKNDYERAGAIWDIKFKGDITCYKPPCNFSFFATDGKWLEWYPELKSAYIKLGDFVAGYSIDQSVSIVFSAASKRIARAAEILNPNRVSESKSLGLQSEIGSVVEKSETNKNISPEIHDLEKQNSATNMAIEADKGFQENEQALLDGEQAHSTKKIESSPESIPSPKATLECASWLATYVYADSDIATRIEKNEWGDFGYFAKRGVSRKAERHPLMMMVKVLASKGGGERELKSVMEQSVAPEVAKLLLQVSGEYPKKKKGEQTSIALPRIQKRAEEVCAAAGETGITFPAISNLSAVTF